VEQVWAISMVRDEEVTIGPVVEHLLAEGVDGIIVADNLSTDRTRRILDGLAKQHRVMVVDDPVEAYLQAEKMTRLARIAADNGASWIVPFDADELWVSPQGRLAEVIRDSGDADVLVGIWYDHYPFPLSVPGRRSPSGPFERMPYRERRPSDLTKVAFRTLPGVLVEQGNHDVTGDGLRRIDGRIVVHHYSYRSFSHMVRKSRNGRRAVEAAGSAIPDEHGWHWRKHGARSTPRLFVTWVSRYVRAWRRGLLRDLVTPSKIP
jgi:glycosyltransferase involved in cell wall biosynthesis